jgi:hypothetical protein
MGIKILLSKPNVNFFINHFNSIESKFFIHFWINSGMSYISKHFIGKEKFIKKFLSKFIRLYFWKSYKISILYYLIRLDHHFIILNLHQWCSFFSIYFQVKPFSQQSKLLQIKNYTLESIRIKCTHDTTLNYLPKVRQQNTVNSLLFIMIHLFFVSKPRFQTHYLIVSIV